MVVWNIDVIEENGDISIGILWAKGETLIEIEIFDEDEVTFLIQETGKRSQIASYRSIENSVDLWEKA